jgi:hypothetical protein
MHKNTFINAIKFESISFRLIDSLYAEARQRFLSVPCPVTPWTTKVGTHVLEHQMLRIVLTNMDNHIPIHALI